MCGHADGRLRANEPRGCLCHFHRALIGSTVTRTLLAGRVCVAHQPGETPDALEPRWIKLKGGGEQLHLQAGAILVAFELVRKKDAVKIPAQSIRPNLKSCSIDISLYGLRDLIMSKTSGKTGSGKDGKVSRPKKNILGSFEAYTVVSSAEDLLSEALFLP